MKNNIASVLTKVRTQTPLVQAITNYVTINDCANILLSYGASPAMVEAYDEAYGFACISSGIYVNVGTLTKEQEQAIIMAGLAAKEKNVPLVIDPVGCGAIPRKNIVIEKLLSLGCVTVIKGNGGEIKHLAGVASQTRGVDSIDSGDGLVDACVSLAKKYNVVVAATGEVDIVTDGDRIIKIHNGHEWLTKVTGAGCMVGALTAAAVAVEEDKLVAAASAIAAMNIAGEKAAEETQGPGSFRVSLIDCIYGLTEELLSEVNLGW